MARMMRDTAGRFRCARFRQTRPMRRCRMRIAGYNLDSIMRIPVSIQVVLGSASMPVANLMKLGRGAVVPLDHRVGEPVDVVVNGRVVAARRGGRCPRGDNSRFGVSLTEIVSAQGGGVGF